MQSLFFVDFVATRRQCGGLSRIQIAAIVTMTIGMNFLAIMMIGMVAKGVI
jgi:hypothetical protein